MELLASSDALTLNVEEFDTATLLKNAARQRDERGLDKMLVVDVATHHHESDSAGEIADYVDDPVMRQLMKSAPRPQMQGGTRATGSPDMGGRVTRYLLRRLEKTEKNGKHRDIQLAHRSMDAMGVDYCCLFPTSIMTLGMAAPVNETIAARAYNAWLCDRLLANDTRVKAMLYLPFNDHKASYDIVREFGGKKGVVGFMMTTVRNTPIWANDYMKIFAAIQELGVPLAFHSGVNWDEPMMRNTKQFVTVQALDLMSHNAQYCTHWIINAMPEKFPKLKVIWIGGGISWATWLSQRLDAEFRMRSSECPGLKKLPSEYFKGMYYTTQSLEKPDDTLLMEDSFRTINAETQLLYASDYPNWDFDLPSVIYDLPFLSETAKRNILGENARKLFNLDISDRFPNYRP